MKERIISGILMSLITIPIVIIGNIPFQIFSGLLGILALKEIINLKIHHQKIPYVMEIISVLNILLCIYLLSYQTIAIVILSLFLPCLFYKDEKYKAGDAFYILGSILLLGIVFHFLIQIREQNLWLLIYLGFIPIATDIFAFLIGKCIGKHKCSPNISPNKTWEGCIGGSLIGTCIGTLIYIFFVNKTFIIKTIGITLLLSVMGQLSDLFFSKIKRENKIKDFSQFIPGHGGILDRLDSLIFVIITYIIVLNYL